MKGRLLCFLLLIQFATCAWLLNEVTYEKIHVVPFCRDLRIGTIAWNSVKGNKGPISFCLEPTVPLMSWNNRKYQTWWFACPSPGFHFGSWSPELLWKNSACNIERPCGQATWRCWEEEGLSFSEPPLSLRYHLYSTEAKCGLSRVPGYK